jgi:hypothetical protein
MNQDALIISNRFSIAEHEIERLRAKINIQHGPWVFKKHIYSIQDLQASEHFDKIYSICMKIGDDISHWHQSKKLSDDGMVTYHRKRAEIDHKLRTVNKEIEARLPTAWENILSILEDFVVLIAKALPPLGKLIKASAGALGVDIHKQLGP